MIGMTKSTTDVMRAIAAYTTARINTSDRGATAVEYGMIVALIAAIIVGVVTNVGKDVLGGFTKVDAAIP